MQIPFHKPYITEEEIAEVADSLRSGWLTMGPKTIGFENAFAAYVGAGHAIAVSSCTAALHLALKVLGLKAGDEVIIPSMTFTATGEVVCYFGAKPVVVDVERDTHNIDVSAIEGAITSRTRAIMPVHFGGLPCDMDAIMSLARSRGLYVVEDAAHALPAWYQSKAMGHGSEVPGDGTSDSRDLRPSALPHSGRMIGTIGDVTCFSFYATKTLATGEGGMITTGKSEWADRVRTLRLHGISKDAWKRYSREGSWYYDVVEAGYKYNMTDIQAGLGLVQLKKVEWMRGRREAIAQRYTSAFGNLSSLLPPSAGTVSISAWHLYVIRLELEALTIGRDRVMEELRERGVGTSVHFIPLHRHPFYRETFGLDAKDFPAAEWLYERCISLPIYPGMTPEETAYVCEAVCDVLKKYRR